MCVLFAGAAVDIVGLFAQWKQVPSELSEGFQRFLVDGRGPNCRFLTPSYEHTTGEDMVRQEVDEDKVRQMARADVAEFFHTFRTIEDLQQYFGLRPVSAEALAKHGITVPPDQVDSAGNTHPSLSTRRSTNPRCTRAGVAVFSMRRTGSLRTSWRSATLPIR